MALPSADEMIMKIERFYDPTITPDERKALDKWLEDVRRAPGAWDLLDNLLTRELPPAQTNTVHTFVATSMKWRIKNEKPNPELGKQLQDRILQHIIRLSGKAQKSVVDNLCMAIIELFKQQPNPAIVAQMCQQMAAPETCAALLSFLDVLGSQAGYILEDLLQAGDDEQELEALNADLRADEAKISHNHPLLLTVRPNFEVVLTLLHSIWGGAQAHPPRVASIFLVLSRWLRFGKVTPEQIVNSPIVQACIPSLAELALQEEAAELAQEIAVLTGENLETWQPVIGFLSSNLLNIHNLLIQNAADEEQADLLTRVICRIGRAFSPFLARGDGDSVAMVGILVKASQQRGKAFDYTIGFWNRIDYQMTKLWKKDPQQHARAQAALSEVLKQLVDVLLTQVMFPPEADKWAAERVDGKKCNDEEDFDKFRWDASQSIWACGQMLGPLVAAERAYAQLRQVVQQPAKWREAEAVLFFLSQLPRPEDGALQDALLPELFTFWQAISHPRVREAFLELIGQEARWLSLSKSADLLPPLVGFVLMCMEDPGIAPAAIECLRKLCRRCQKQMVHLFPQLQERVNNWGHLKADAAKSLMQALGSLSTALPGEHINTAVEKLCAPCMVKLQTENPAACQLELSKLLALYQGVDEANDKRERDAWTDAEHEEAMARVTHVQQAWANGFNAMWDTVHKTVQRFVKHSGVMENVCGLVRGALHTTDKHFSPVLERLVTTLVEAYNAQPQSAILWVMGMVVSTFGDSPEYVGPIMQVMTLFVERTVTLLGSVGPNVGEYSDYIQELFYIVRMSLLRFPKRLLTSPMMQPVFELSLASLVNTNVTREAVFQGVLKFLLDLANPNLSKLAKEDCATEVQQYLAGKQKQMCEAMLNAVINRDLDSSDRIGDILCSLRTMVPPEDFQQWIHHGLTVIPGDVPPDGRLRCFNEINAARTKDEWHSLLERLHREAPQNWR
eukprot:TRINITY_DN1642_c2_g1_i2.p1 TRINITY_DN1642_c2_g1~~TRINITY_DN1642_c2_g1_i2.p1  ORF type:complete len:962 (+),score=334.57 TRINITY_DN1642_c2_g1_i2:108-2993(+)